jgi:hypothetical protein
MAAWVAFFAESLDDLTLTESAQTPKLPSPASLHTTKVVSSKALLSKALGPRSRAYNDHHGAGSKTKGAACL